jgi:hypothetical protein
MICLGDIQSLSDAGRNGPSLPGMLGQMLGTVATNYMQSKKVAAPMAAFRHYGRVGEPMYFGFASDRRAREFPPGQFLYVQ